MFPDKEHAQEFTERVAEQVREQPEGVRRDREIMGEVVAEEFAKTGHPVSSYTHPWEHTSEEHTEAQRLVDIAFQQDLDAALKQAQSSKSFPRILDLFHDVLTGEMYDVLVQSQMNRQPLMNWLVVVGSILAVLLLIFFLIVVLG